MTAQLDRALLDAAQGTGPTTVMLMRVLGEALTETDGRSALVASIARCEAKSDGLGAARLRAVQALWMAHPSAWSVVRTTLANVAHDMRAADPDAVLRYWADAFDLLSAASPEASVALYALGSAELLAAATEEIVDLMQRLSLLDPAQDVLDLGCGIGRFLAPLALRSRRVLGLDLSAGMVAEARRRCGQIGNVQIEQTKGRDLSLVPNASCNLVLAVDVFPYLVQAGVCFAERHLTEFERVLRPGGAALILNYSYRGDLEADRRDLSKGATELGLSIGRNGTSDLALWDGTTFLLRKPI